MLKFRKTKEMAKELGFIRKRSSKGSSDSLAKRLKRTEQIFSYLIVIDFESTCWQDTKHRGQEIIEFPAVLLNTMTGEIEGEFHHYVLPREYPVLSSFCKQLTGISQDMVEQGIPLSTCLVQFTGWLRKLNEDKGIEFTQDSPNRCTFVTWSDWDLGVCLEYETRRKQIRKPAALNSWVDLRATYRKFYARKPDGLNGALQAVGIKFEGREHSGLDDARNTAKLAWKMMCDGCVMQITKCLPGATQGHIPSCPYRHGKGQSTLPGCIIGPQVKVAGTLINKPVLNQGLGTAQVSVSTVKSRHVSNQPAGARGSNQTQADICYSNFSMKLGHKDTGSIYESGKRARDNGSTRLIHQASMKQGHCMGKAQTRSHSDEQPRVDRHFKVVVETATSHGNVDKKNALPMATEPSYAPRCHSKTNQHQTKAAGQIIPHKLVSSTVTMAAGSLSKNQPRPAQSYQTSLNNPYRTTQNQKQNVQTDQSANQILPYKLASSKMPASKSCKVTSSVTKQDLDKLGSNSGAAFKSPVGSNIQKQRSTAVMSASDSPHVNQKENALGNGKTGQSGSVKRVKGNQKKVASVTKSSSPLQTISNTFKTPANGVNPQTIDWTHRKTPPMCKCGRRAKRRLVQSPGPNVGRLFFSCPLGRAGSNKGCGFFKWDNPSPPSVTADGCFGRTKSVIYSKPVPQPDFNSPGPDAPGGAKKRPRKPSFIAPCIQKMR